MNRFHRSSIASSNEAKKKNNIISVQVVGLFIWFNNSGLSFIYFNKEIWVICCRSIHIIYSRHIKCVRQFSTHYPLHLSTPQLEFITYFKRFYFSVNQRHQFQLFVLIASMIFEENLQISDNPGMRKLLFLANKWRKKRIETNIWGPKRVAFQ